MNSVVKIKRKGFLVCMALFVLFVASCFCFNLNKTEEQKESIDDIVNANLEANNSGSGQVVDRNIFEMAYDVFGGKDLFAGLADFSVKDRQRTLNVPEDFASIQEAIDIAEAGDVVMVAAGEYRGNVVMKDGVSVIGAGAESTILDAEKSGNVVTFKNIVDADTRLEGFTIKNSEENLSGVMVEDSSPIINRNVILDNDYDIYIKGESSPTIQRNRLSASKAGVQIFNLEKPENSLPVIIDNFIFQNKKGVNVYKANVKIEHNTISYNDSYGSYAGATFGIYLTSGGAEIKNNIITDNGTCELCSGIYADEESSGVVIDYNNLWNNKNNLLCFGECEMLGNNFSMDSAFINAVEYDFSLSEDSPFFESGSDGKRLGSRI